MSSSWREAAVFLVIREYGGGGRGCVQRGADLVVRSVCTASCKGRVRTVRIFATVRKDAWVKEREGSSWMLSWLEIPLGNVWVHPFGRTKIVLWVLSPLECCRDLKSHPECMSPCVGKDKKVLCVSPCIWKDKIVLWHSKDNFVLPNSWTGTYEIMREELEHLIKMLDVRMGYSGLAHMGQSGAGSNVSLGHTGPVSFQKSWVLISKPNPKSTVLFSSFIYLALFINCDYYLFAFTYCR